MNLSNIIQSVNNFYKKVFLFSFAREVSKSNPETNDILEKAENLDIKDEDLYNLFSKFIEVYKEFLEEIEFDISDLESDNFGEAAELAGKLQKLYNQIQQLPYLSLSEEEGYEEEFSVDELTELLNKAMDNASSTIQNASGMEISDAAAAQIANEFNNQQIDKGSFSNSGLRMTGVKVQQKLLATRNWLQRLKFNYESAQAYKAKRNQWFQKFKEQNPEIYKALVDKKNKNRDIRNEKRKRLLKLINETTDLNLKKQLEQELIKFEENNKKHLTRKDYEGKEMEISLNLEQALNQADVLGKQRLRNQISNVNKKQRKESGGIVAAIDSIGVKISTLKQAAKRQISDQVSEDPKLSTLKQQLNELGQKIKTSPSMELLKLQENLEKQYTQLAIDLMNKNEKIIEIKNDIDIIIDYRDRVSKAFKAGWISPEATTEHKDFSLTFIAEGRNLYNTYNKKYGAVGKSLENLTNEISLIIS